MKKSLKECFDEMGPEQRLEYVISNLRSLPDELVDPAIDLLLRANEIEYAVVLCREHGMIQRAVDILVDAGDYLWAAQITKSAGFPEEADRLLRSGLEYYISMEMYGRAISAATALKLPPDQIDALYREGIAFESKSLDLGRAHAALESLMSAVAMLEMDEGMKRDLMDAIQDELDRERSSATPPPATRSRTQRKEDDIDGGRFC
ncbi:MAG: hypothetical protein QHG98_02855 [Methanothrix sp.]|jgi:hypothetical protein|uniref:hypothetical protein n=1 Tax=Methanothrix sp. TaxID=90426 RepID=UPI00247D0113|nr:hypothetical protein [Methanothrix sp.]